MITKSTFLTSLILTLVFLPVFAQMPDPRDSVILESKEVQAGFNAGAPSDTSAYVYLQVWITNKDSIGTVLLPLEEKILVGDGYVSLAWPRNFDGVVSRLTPTLGSSTQLFEDRYNGISPDTFMLIGESDFLDTGTIEPPNTLRKPLWDIKFDTVYGGGQSGQVRLDSTLISTDTSLGFVDLLGNKIKVNFYKSNIGICPCGDTFPTIVEEIQSLGIPKAFSLFQNYPNPFNANTQFTFALPKPGRVTLEVLNILGQKVSTLVDEYLSAGNKTVNWDGRDDRGIPVSSGIYLYQLQSGNFVQRKKMVLLK